jgi:hypothetical protein
MTCVQVLNNLQTIMLKLKKEDEVDGGKRIFYDSIFFFLSSICTGAIEHPCCDSEILKETYLLDPEQIDDKKEKILS